MSVATKSPWMQCLGLPSQERKAASLLCCGRKHGAPTTGRPGLAGPWASCSVLLCPFLRLLWRWNGIISITAVVQICGWLRINCTLPFPSRGTRKTQSGSQPWTGTTVWAVRPQGQLRNRSKAEACLNFYSPVWELRPSTSEVQDVGPTSQQCHWASSSGPWGYWTLFCPGHAWFAIHGWPEEVTATGSKDLRSSAFYLPIFHPGTHKM